MAKNRREGRWLCASCGRENLGRHEICEEGCGRARDKNVRFYLPENSPIITDPDLVAEAGAGPNWNCDHCGGANTNLHQGNVVISCGHCGQGRDGRDTTNQVRSYASGAAPRTAGQARPKRPSRRKKSTPVKQSRRRKLPKILAVVALVIVAIAATLSLIVPVSSSGGEVVSKSWSRSIGVEEVRTEIDDGWSLPIGARLLTSEERIRSYKDVVVGYEADTRTEMQSVKIGEEDYKCGNKDLGNGYFEDIMCLRDITEVKPVEVPFDRPITEEVPVMGTWSTYEIDRWYEIRRPRTSGTGESLPAWPEPIIASDERAGTKTQSYIVRVLKDDGSRIDLPIEYGAYQNITPGDQTVTLRNFWGKALATTFPGDQPD